MDSLTRDEGRCSLAAEALRSWGVLQLRAAGVSMLPTLWPGDLLTVQSHGTEQVEAGEIVLYIHEKRFFIHRVVSRNLNQGEAFLVTRGDCMSEDDPPVGRAELLGKVTEVRRPGSVFVPATRLSLPDQFLAWLFCHWSLFRRAGLRLWNFRQARNSRVDSALVSPAH